MLSNVILAGIPYMYIHIYRAGRSDTGAGTSDTPALSEVDLGVGVKCRKSEAEVSQAEV